MTHQVSHPESADEFGATLRAARDAGQTVRIVGGQSKSRNSAVSEGAAGCHEVSTLGFAGITEHQASDFTITARSGTLVAQLVATLAAAGQYLPFDPVFADRGATVGGLVATGLNGPCRLRFGGLRDFVIGCQFVDGNGQPVNSGGRVVKNAAGFDLPKFLIGSAVRFALLTEVTFKVFPQPLSYRTAYCRNPDIETALRVASIVIDHLDCDAVEISDQYDVTLRVSAMDDSAFEQQLDRCSTLAGQTFERVAGEEERELWRERVNPELAGDSILVKVPVTPASIPGLDLLLKSRLADRHQRRYSAAGNVALVQLGHEDLPAAHQLLLELNLAGQMIAGSYGHYLLGHVSSLPFLRRIKRALDPANLFGTIEPGLA